METIINTYFLSPRTESSSYESESENALKEELEQFSRF